MKVVNTLKVNRKKFSRIVDSSGGIIFKLTSWEQFLYLIFHLAIVHVLFNPHTDKKLSYLPPASTVDCIIYFTHLYSHILMNLHRSYLYNQVRHRTCNLLEYIHHFYTETDARYRTSDALKLIERKKI